MIRAREDRLRALLQAIRSRCADLGERPGLESVYLFGSYARGDFSGASDVDLLVILARPDEQLAAEVRESLSDLADDLLVVTEEGYRRELPGSFFWRQVDRDRVEVWRRRRG